MLRLRIDEPGLTSREVAERVSAGQAQPMTAAWARKTLQRAHTKFADLLIAEVARSLERPAVDQFRSELQELDLLKYCRPALDRWAARR